MSLWVCDPDQGGCTTRYSVGAPRCPHCGKTAAYELGDEQRRNVRNVPDEPPAQQPAAVQEAQASGEPDAGAPAARPARPARRNRSGG